MTVELLGDSDGRRTRAYHAIRKLRALGLTQADVITLMRELDTQRKEESPGPATDQETGKAERLDQAQWIIRFMLALGFTEIEIAAMTNVDHTTIAHAIDPDEPRAPGSKTVRKLKEALQNAGAERLKFLLSRVAITVLDTCNDKGQALDTGTRTDIAGRTRADLQNALAFAPAPAPFVPGIHAALAQVGDPVHGLYLVKVRSKRKGTPQEQIIHLGLVEHEIQHILDRVREERQHLEKGERSKRHVPKDGSIA